MATGERILDDPTVPEIGSVPATNTGVDMRFNLAPWADQAPAYGFVEYSHRTTNDPTLDGDRIFAGLLVQY